MSQGMILMTTSTMLCHVQLIYGVEKQCYSQLRSSMLRKRRCCIACTLLKQCMPLQIFHFLSQCVYCK
jgi:hypothetical protein